MRINEIIYEAQWEPEYSSRLERPGYPEHGRVNPTDPSRPARAVSRPGIEDPEGDEGQDILPGFAHDPDMTQELFSQEVSSWLDSHKRMFTRQEWYAIKMRLDGESTIDDIARTLGLPRARAVSVEAKALRKLRNDPEFVAKFGAKTEGALGETPASRALCTSGKPDSALGASQLASCKSQGYRARDGGKSHKIGSKRTKVRGKKIKGKKYGGPLPDWS